MFHSLTQQHLARAPKRTKTQADKGCSERQFSVDDWVYLKLQPYVHASLAPRANKNSHLSSLVPFRSSSEQTSHTSSGFRTHWPSILSSMCPSSRRQCLQPAVAALPHSLDGLQFPTKILQQRVYSSDHAVVPHVLVQCVDYHVQCPHLGLGGHRSSTTVFPSRSFLETSRSSSGGDVSITNQGTRSRHGHQWSMRGRTRACHDHHAQDSKGTTEPDTLMWSQWERVGVNRRLPQLRLWGSTRGQGPCINLSESNGGGQQKRLEETKPNSAT
jgi:hypothetical protein